MYTKQHKCANGYYQQYIHTQTDIRDSINSSKIDTEINTTTLATNDSKHLQCYPLM